MSRATLYNKLKRLNLS
nr:hypothetical protein [Paenibacillus sp. JCM 10914]